MSEALLQEELKQINYINNDPSLSPDEKLAALKKLRGESSKPLKQTRKK